MIIVYQILILITTLFLAGKDASSYLLKDKNDTESTMNRIKRWHRDGVALYILAVLPYLYLSYPNIPALILVLISSLLIRLSIFDLAFNKWANLSITYLGSTSSVDRFFIGIFGANGAVKKSLAFAILLVLVNIVYFIYF